MVWIREIQTGKYTWLAYYVLKSSLKKSYRVKLQVNLSETIRELCITTRRACAEIR